MSATPTTSKIVNLAGLIRTVTKDLAETTQETTILTTITPSQISSVFKCIGNFVNFAFKKQVKDHYVPGNQGVVADIAQFGTIFRVSGSAASDFVPAPLLQQECARNQGELKLSEHFLRHELTLAKMSTVTQLSEAQLISVLG